MNKYLHNRKYFPYMFIALVSFFTILIWFREGKLLYFADSTYPIGFPIDYIKSFFYGWNPNYSGGNINSTGFAILPLFIFIFIIESLGFSQVFAQAIFFFLILCTTGMSIIALLRFLGKKFDIKENSISLIAPSIFYMFSLYIAINGWRMIVFLYLFYALLPLLILLFLKYLDSEKNTYIIQMSLVSSLVAVIALTNAAFLFILIGLLMIVGFLYIGEKKISKLFYLYFKAFIIWLPLNIWYLLPQFLTISDSATKATGGGNFNGSLSILNVISSQASFLNILTLRGYYSLYDIIAGPWFKWSNLYIDSPLLLLTFIFPIMLISVVLDKSIKAKAKRLLIFGTTLILIGAFFSKGSHDPFGSVFLLLVKYFPIPFLAFRAAYEKLGIIVVFGYSIIIYLFINFSLRKWNKYSNVLGILILYLILIISFPMWTGLIFDSNNNIRTSSRVLIPSDYFQVAKILKADKNALSLSLPLLPHAWISSKWNNGNNGYLGNDILRLLSQTPIISTTVGNENLDNFNRSILKDFTGNSVNLVNIIARQIKYLIVRKDFNYSWSNAYESNIGSISYFRNSIENSNHFKKVIETENLILYQLIDPNPENFIYSSENLYQFPRDINLKIIDNFIKQKNNGSYIFTLQSNLDVPNRQYVRLSDNSIESGSFRSKNKDDKNKQITSNLAKPPGINYSSISPVEVKISVRGIVNPFYLVNNSTYNSNWIISCKDKLMKSPHFEVNGFVNGWYIDPEYIKKNFSKEYYKQNADGSIDVELTLYFKPQSYFYLGLIISGATLLGCLGYLIYDFLKSRNKRRPVSAAPQPL